MRERRGELASETPLADLMQPLTPAGTFFVRNHARDVPHVTADAFRLEIAGVQGTRVLRLADLRALPRVSEIVTLACAGNARTAFDPVPDGVPWGFGAISTARWDGVRLRDVVQLAGVRSGDGHVVFDAYDAAPDAERPPYRRSLPLARALVDGTLVADTMNGEPLPAEHGGPVRLVVAGWTANHSLKWLRRIAVTVEADDGHWMTNDYRVPGPNGSLEILEATAPIAILATPAAGAVCRRAVVLHGIAYGEPAPRHVRIEIDGERVADAPVRYDDGPYAWGRWSLAVTLGAGAHRLAVHPVDANGDVGPARATWNAKGYRYDGPHVVDVEVV